jgi:hypothetical protein
MKILATILIRTTRRVAVAMIPEREAQAEATTRAKAARAEATTQAQAAQAEAATRRVAEALIPEVLRAQAALQIREARRQLTEAQIP